MVRESVKRRTTKKNDGHWGKGGSDSCYYCRGSFPGS